MKATSARILFGLLLGLAAGVCFGLAARTVIQSLLRTNYNSYYAESGSGLPALGMLGSGLISGLLVPLINRRSLRPAVGAAAWTVSTLIFLPLPFVYGTLLMPGPVMAACIAISLLAGALVGGIASWVDLP